jgi:hypothetical protein
MNLDLAQMHCGVSGGDVYEQILTLQAPADAALYIWFEPWAEGLAIPAGSAIELRATSPVSGQLELDATSGRTAVYGWSGSTLLGLVDGTEVIAFNQPVPDLLNREKISMLFGPPPVPTAQDRNRALNKPWWRFWS